MTKTKIRVIVFDFDGVLINSNQLKHEGWFAVFSPTDRDVVESVLKNLPPFPTRAEVFRCVLTAKGVCTDKLVEEVAAVSSRYNDFVQREIEKLGLMSGVRETLEKLSCSYPLYINSGTPEPAVRESVQRLGAGHFFKGILGRRSLTTKKSEILKEIIDMERITADELLMVGDADLDFEGAVEAGCCFVGVANDYNGWQEKEFPLIKNITELFGFL